MSNAIFEVQENTNLSGPLTDIDVPAGQQVTLGPSSTPYAFRIQGTQLFLNVTPDYEVQTAGLGGAPTGAAGRLTFPRTCAATRTPPRTRAFQGSWGLCAPQAMTDPSWAPRRVGLWGDGAAWARKALWT